MRQCQMADLNSAAADCRRGDHVDANEKKRHAAPRWGFQLGCVESGGTVGAPIHELRTCVFATSRHSARRDDTSALRLLILRRTSSRAGDDLFVGCYEFAAAMLDDDTIRCVFRGSLGVSPWLGG